MIGYTLLKIAFLLNANTEILQSKCFSAPCFVYFLLHYFIINIFSFECLFHVFHNHKLTEGIYTNVLDFHYRNDMVQQAVVKTTGFD